MKTKKFTILLISLVCVSSVVLAYWWNPLSWFQFATVENKKNEGDSNKSYVVKVNQVNTLNKPASTNASSVLKDSTTIWLKHKDSVSGIEILYPSNWFVFSDFNKFSNTTDPDSQVVPLIKNKTVVHYLALGLVNSSNNIDEFRKLWKNGGDFSKYEKLPIRYSGGSFSETKENEKIVLRRTYTADSGGKTFGYGLGEGYFVDYAIFYSNKLYLFTLRTGISLTEETKKHLDIFDQMLKSLKFIEVIAPKNDFSIPPSIPAKGT